MDIGLMFLGLCYVLAAINNWNLEFPFPQREDGLYGLGETQSRILIASFGLVLMATGVILYYRR